MKSEHEQCEITATTKYTAITAEERASSPMCLLQPRVDDSKSAKERCWGNGRPSIFKMTVASVERRTTWGNGNGFISDDTLVGK